MRQRSTFILLPIVIVMILASGCTEKNTPQEPKCGIENCHGLDITCGSSVPDACTEIYMFGDRCRQYVICVMIEEECRLLENERFDTCRLCIEKCKVDFVDDISKAFECESRCPQSPTTSETYCRLDEDCTCGVHINTRDCFYGNKDYVDTKDQCPDFCTGIAGNLKIVCIDNECRQTMTTQ